MNNEFGDFQTPDKLVDLIINRLFLSRQWDQVLEPTCGRGNFISGVIRRSPETKIYGIEIRDEYVEQSKSIGKNVTVFNGDIFKFDLKSIPFDRSKSLMVIGNPPWITNANQGVLNSSNLPKKNIRKKNGLDSITGNSNFDISESIWLKIIEELSDFRLTIAMLSKISVARNILSYISHHRIPIKSAEICEIDAKRWFKANVDACLLVIDTDEIKSLSVNIYPSLTSHVNKQTLEIHNGTIQSHQTTHIDGKFPMVWRQGVKHDAKHVMELSKAKGIYHNNLGEPVEVEPDYIYPLMKASDVNAGRFRERYVIITQKHTSQSTLDIEFTAPKLWEYLKAHSAFFEKRKSRIYRNRQPFSIFGIGEYSFLPYKVGISGFHKIPKFTAIGPIDNKPVILDDTCYSIGFESAAECAIMATMLNHKLVHDFLVDISFSGAKRPITKRILQRIGINQIATPVNIDNIEDTIAWVNGNMFQNK